jgi:hypothetical protein
MKKIIGVILFSLILAVGSVSAQKDYCFKNIGLKVTLIVSFTLTGNKIEGTMGSGGDDETTSAETFEFTGTKTGNILTVKFAGKAPYELAPGTNKIVWAFSPAVLKVPMYGKNYNTRKYSAYTVSFGKCKKD